MPSRRETVLPTSHNSTTFWVLESIYGVTPGSVFRKLPFVSAHLSEKHSLIEGDLVGHGRNPLTLTYDVVSNESDSC